ncbi:MAG: hypothetical protein S4CHLAM37_04390 [Chlamydiia bacterium]|nr:hypothetical protein [Chlamydiia bacterium]
MKRFLLYFPVFVLLHLNANIYFVHVPKTGGGSLFNVLNMQLHESEVFHIISMTNFRFAPRQRIDLSGFKLVSGHQPVSVLRRLDPKFDTSFKITILRDPQQRFYSNVNHVQLNTNMKINELLESVDLGKNTLYSNAFCKYFATDFNLEGEALLESAKEELLKFDCVIFFDNYVEEANFLLKRLGLDIDMKKSAVLHKHKKFTPNSTQLETIIGLNSLDTRLYEWAKVHFKNRSESLHPLKTSFPLKPTIKEGEYQFTFLSPVDGYGWGERSFINFAQKECCCRSIRGREAVIYFPLIKKDYSIRFEGIFPECFSGVKLFVDNKEIQLKENRNFRMDELPRLSMTLNNSRKLIVSKNVFKPNEKYISVDYQGTIPLQSITTPKVKLVFVTKEKHSEVYKNHTRKFPYCVCRLTKISLTPID